MKAIFDRVALGKKISLLVMIPFIAYLFMIGTFLAKIFDHKNQATEAIENVEGIEHISQLIGHIQVERGVTAVFIKSARKKAREKLATARESSDLYYPPVLAFLKSHIRDKDQSLLGLLNNLNRLRVSADSDGNLTDLLKGYTNLVTALRAEQKALANISPPKIAAKIRSYALLEAARENAGLLRANLSGILAADTAISDPTFYKILKLKSWVDANLHSEGLLLSQTGVNRILEFEQQEHWLHVNTVFARILKNSKIGSFNEDPQEFFTTISKCVTDIANILQLESRSIRDIAEQDLSLAKSEILYSTSLSVIFSIFLCFVIYFMIGLIKLGLIRSMKQVEKVSTELIQSSDRLKETTVTIKLSTQKQYEAVESSSSSMTQISNMTKNNVENSSRTAKSANTGLTNVLDAIESMKKLVDSMDQIKESTQLVSEIVIEMGRIREKTQDIDDIVFQTKLLAFNASIEAERAGEHGRGFSVVAQEVGNLARSSGTAAVEISNMIKKSVKYTEDIAKKNKMIVEQAVRLVGDSATRLNSIKSNTESIAKDSTNIDHASKEQSSGLIQVEGALKNLEQSIETTRQSVESTDSIGLELQTYSQSLEHSINDLLVQVEGSNTAPREIEAFEPEKELATTEDTRANLKSAA